MTFPEFVGYFGEINRYSGLPGVLFFLLYLSKERGNARIVFFVILASFVADLANFFFIRYVYANSFIISNTWYLINYILVSWLFLTLIPDRKRFILALGIVFIIGSAISFGFFFSFFESNTFIRTYTSLAFTFLASFAFFEILREGPTDKLSNYPIFWITTGIFLHSSITLLRNLFSNYLVFDMEASWELMSYVSLFNLIFNITKNLLFFYAFYLVYKGYPDYIKESTNSKEK